MPAKQFKLKTTALDTTPKGSLPAFWNGKISLDSNRDFRETIPEDELFDQLAALKVGVMTCVGREGGWNGEQINYVAQLGEVLGYSLDILKGSFGSKFWSRSTKLFLEARRKLL